MKLHDIEQRTPEWLALRAKCFVTASEAAAFFYKSDARSESARTNFISKKLAEPIYANESLAGYEFLQQIREKEAKQFDYNIPVQRGNALEGTARDWYARHTGLEVREIGFATTDDEVIGASPDAIVYDGGTLVRGGEFKCPVPETHIKWLFDGGLPDEHKHQVHCSMIVLGVDRWDFMSFCPGLPPLLVPVHRDKFTSELEAGIRTTHGKYIEARRKLAALWDGKEAA